MIGSALIVGGGVAGMSAAIALRRTGCEVDLIDADPHWRVYGAGISLTGLSLRAFDALGLLEPLRQRGFIASGMRIRGVSGQLLLEIPASRTPAPIEQGGGILRPVLHEILSTAVRDSGVRVALGVQVASLEQSAGGADVRFSDGRAKRYELIVGADGIHSPMRERILPNAPPPRLTGQGCWRIVAPRPAEVDRTEMFVGGPVKLGLNPVSREQMYLFVLERVADHGGLSADAQVSHLRRLLAPFGGCITAVRERLSPAAQIIYRPLEWVLVPDPWYVGRVVLIGDAAHATTPHLASGAGIAAEDGLVLAEELHRHDDVTRALRAFMDRRFGRARLVVESSVRIGESQLAGEDSAGSAELGATMARLSAPY